MMEREAASWKAKEERGRIEVRKTEE